MKINFIKLNIYHLGSAILLLIFVIVLCFTIFIRYVKLYRINKNWF